MITVIPVQEKARQAEFCALCGIPYRAELLAYAAYNERKEFVGICQFNMNETGGHLYHLTTPNGQDTDDALFVMGRAALNFIDLCGVKIAYFEGDVATQDALLRRIGFTTDTNGRYVFPLDGFFTQPCKCNH